MILRNKKILMLIPVYLLYFSAILLLILATDRQILLQIFTDRVYTYLIVPPYICGIILIDESVKKTCLIRMKSRTQALSFLLIQQYIYSVFYLTAWFFFIALFAKIGNEQINAVDILLKLIRYILSLLIFTNLAELFKRLNIKFLSSIPFFAAYSILILDVLAITAITGRQSNIVYLLFSWTFHKNSILSIAMLGIFFAITFVLLHRIDRKADFY